MDRLAGAYLQDRSNHTTYVDEGIEAEEIGEFLGIKKTLDMYGDLLLATFTYEELLTAYGPVFEVWYAQLYTHHKVFKYRSPIKNYDLFG